MSNELILGQLLSPNQVRDAFHVAVAPVTAAEVLSPGTHVGLIPNEVDTVGRSDNPIGIVDPFLKDHVKPGDRIWLWLYPNTVTGMRHLWSHPAFDGPRVIDVDPAKPAVKVNRKRSSAERWLREIATAYDLDFDHMVEMAKEADQYGSACPGEEEAADNMGRVVDIPNFWDIFSTYLGKELSSHSREDIYFRCAC